MTEHNDHDITTAIKELLVRQPLAVLATQGDGQPYTSLMAYAYTKDLRFIVVATAMSSRKHLNILDESRVALLVDDRSNNEEDFQNATALTIVGEACEIAQDEREAYCRIYLDRHPALETFLTSSATTLLKIAVHKYLLVSKFEDVREYNVED
jgi:heme iron utilization protein